jgi:hypothetical protein
MAKCDNRFSDVNLKNWFAGRTNGTTPTPFASRNKVIMSPIETLKAEAVALQAKEKALGRILKHCDALEQVAKNHGYDNWRACLAVLSSTPPAVTTPPEEKAQMTIPEMKRYVSSEWNFALDIPKRWNSFPPVPTNSQYEVIRFRSHEEGIHLLIVFRMPHNPIHERIDKVLEDGKHLLIDFRMPNNPKKSIHERIDKVKEKLASKGFGNFSTAETTIGSRAAMTLDFDKLQDAGTWSCRHYFITEGTLWYTLGFGTSNKASMFELYDRMAQSFEILAESPPPGP